MSDKVALASLDKPFRSDDERAGLPSASFSIKYKCLGAWNLIQACKAAGLIGDDGGAAAESGTDVHRYRAGEDVALSDVQVTMAQTLKAIELETVDALYKGFTFIGREMRLWLREGLRPLSSGKYDAAYAGVMDNREAVAIFDDKTGWLEVDAAERNLQMRDLAALWHFNHPETRQADVIIIQPRISHEPSIARYDYADLQEALELLREALRLIADPDAPRTPGFHCRHCPAKIHCNEAQDWAVKHPRSLVARIRANEIRLPLGEQGSDVLERLSTGYNIFNQLWTCYEEAIKADPSCLPGWHMADGALVERFTNAKEAMELVRKAGLTEKRRNKPSLKPIPQRGRKALKS